MALNPLGLFPLLGALALVALVVAGAVDERFDRWLTRMARRLFGRYVRPSPERTKRLRAAYIQDTYRAYAARTLLYTAFAAVGGAIVGAYLFGGILLAIPPLVELLLGLPETMVAAFGLRGFELVLTETQTLVIITAGALIGGLGGAGGTYFFRWILPRSRAEARRRGINEGLARTVAFMYALSRGGISFPDVLRIVGDHRAIYGETANEFTVAAREMDVFGRDMITALRRMAERTPSERFKTFSENLASVLQSGRSVSEFFYQQYDRFQEGAEERQEELLDRLSTIAEAYVTLLVAGVLFFITILLVFGLTITDTLWLLQLFAYLVIPLANGLFMLYLSDKLDQLGIGWTGTVSVLDELSVRTMGRPDAEPGPERTDGGSGVGAVADNWARLAFYDRVETAKHIVGRPVRTVLAAPARVFYLTAPVAVVWIAIRAPTLVSTGVLNIRALDDLVIRVLLFLLGTYAVVRIVYVRRIRRIEAALPDLLERMASLNDAGMTVVEGLDRVRGTDLGVLTPEVKRIWRDIKLGANVEDAFVRFGRRVRTVAVTRVVVLLVNAMRASGDLGDVLRIAATQARDDLRLRRRRRQQMLTYLVVIYISFLVFLVIIGSVQEVLIPSLPSNVPTPENTGRLGVNTDQLSRIGSVDKAAYTLVFFHTTMIQAICSGFVGGQLGEGTIRDGAKHAAAMLGVAYVAFLLLSSPVASITVDNPATADAEITLDSVSLSEGGYVVVYEEELGGRVLGRTEYLPAGTHRSVDVELSRPPDTDLPIVLVPYLDSDGDQQFDPAVDEPYTASDGESATKVEIDLD
ncbi:MAG: type II secretion system F family protein [Haloarculaceae archaeon]